MPNKNQANIPVQILTKKKFDNTLVKDLKKKLKITSYNQIILKLIEKSKEIVKLY